jgi:predicted nucleotidyltransferase
MIELTEQVLNEMVEAIVAEVAPEKIILFGSRARGRAGPGSDVDLVVIEKESFGPHRSRSQELDRINRVLEPFRGAKDVLVFSEDELEKWKHAINHVLADVVREGRPLYERS